MTRIMKQNLFPIAALCLLAACGQDDITGGNDTPCGEKALHVVSVYTGAPSTEASSRVSSSTVLKGGSMGIFRAADSGADAVYPTECTNMRYTFMSTSGRNGWYPDATDQTVYLAGKNVNVCAYYPYNPANTDKTAIPIASFGNAHRTGENPVVSEDVYYTTMELNASRPDVSFVLRHAMASMEFQFSHEAGTLFEVQAITIKDANLPASATVDITNGTYENRTLFADGKFHYEVYYSADAMLVPFTVSEAGIELSFEVKDINTCKATLPKSLFTDGEIKGGYRYVVDVRLNPMEITKVEIVPWDPVTVEDGSNPFPI